MSDSGTHIPFEELLAHRAWVRGLARRLVQDGNRADDVEQEVWLSAIRKPPVHAHSLRAWLARLVRSRAFDSHRRDSRRTGREEAAARTEGSPSAASLVAKLEAHRKLVVALEGLREPYRETVLLRYFEDLPPREVAARLGAPVETVRTRLKRAREMLRRQLDGDHGGDGRGWLLALAPLFAEPPAGLPAKSPTPSPLAGAPRFAAAPIAAGIAVFLAVGLSVLTLVRDGPSSTPRTPIEGRAVAAPVLDPRESRADFGAETRLAARAGPSDLPLERTAQKPAPVSGPQSVLVRDMADGAPMPGFELIVRMGGQEKLARSGEAGRAGLPEAGVDAIRPRNDSWKMPGQSVGAVLRDGELWLYRIVTVRGTVSVDPASPPLNPTEAELASDWSGPGARDAQWAARLSRPRNRTLPSPTIDGEFYVRIPAIEGVRLSATARGYVTEHADIPLERRPDQLREAHFVLRRAPRVVGTVRGSDGSPLGNLRLHLIGTSGGSLYGQTGPDGTIDLAVEKPGEAALFVPPAPGHRPACKPLGWLGRGDLRVDLALEALPLSPKVRLLLRGEALTGQRLRLTLRLPGGSRASYDAVLDREGRLPAGMLFDGHVHQISVVTGSQPPLSGASNRLLAFGGSEQDQDIELTDLPDSSGIRKLLEQQHEKRLEAERKTR